MTSMTARSCGPKSRRSSACVAPDSAIWRTGGSELSLPSPKSPSWLPPVNHPGSDSSSRRPLQSEGQEAALP